MAAGGSSAKVGTAYEQLIGKLMDGEGDPGKASEVAVCRECRVVAVCLWVKKRNKALLSTEATLEISKLCRRSSQAKLRGPACPWPGYQGHCAISGRESLSGKLRLCSDLGKCFTLLSLQLRQLGRGVEEER